MKRILFFLLTIFYLTSATAQESAEAALMRYAGNIHQFNSIFPQEKVYLQFDNTSYYTGETIWFKAFVVSASTLGRAQSKVLYVDLISPDGVLLKQQKLKIVAGQADGSLPLLDGSTAQARDLRGVLGYPSGFYEVRAYTNFMLNFGNENLFSRVFAVYEKPTEEGNYYEESPTINIRKSDVKSRRPETPKQRKINATFHPEGGHIIIGQPCRVAFKVTDEDGLGVDAEGILNDTGLSFSTMHDGMGWFEFTPQKRHNNVEFTVGGSSRTFELPDAETEGCTLRADVTPDDNISLTISTSDAFRNKQLGITVTCRGELMDFAAISTDEKQNRHEFKLQSMPEGVYRITLFNTEGVILATRSFYHRNTNIPIPTLSVSSDKKSYAPFEKVSLSFSLSDGKGAPFRDRFCLAVRDSRSQASIYHDDLRTSLLLSSDLKGLIENPYWYFNPENPDRMEQLDLLCMVQGWERYDWRMMAGVDEFKEVHRQENGLTLNGWIMNPAGNAPMENVEVNAAMMPRDKTMSETYTYNTDQTGYFGFDIGAEFYDKARLTISVSTGRKRLLSTSARIMFERSMQPQVRAYEPGEKIFTSSSAINSHKGKVEKNIDDGLPMIINEEKGFVLPDVEINEHRKYVDYYTFKAYDVMSDVELDLDKGEYTTDVLGYLIEKGYRVIFSTAQDGTDSIESINEFEPFFYVHNNKTYKYTGIYETPTKIDTRDVKSILVYDQPLFKKEAWMLAPLFLDHLARTLENIESNPGRYDRVTMVDIQMKEDDALSTRKELFNLDKRITTVDGFSFPYSFYSPEYPTGPIPGDVDYRRTLYWNPNVITDENGNVNVEFYNSSITKHFNVEAAGITSSGVPYTLDAGF
jgi:hypothetical protein